MVQELTSWSEISTMCAAPLVPQGEDGGLD